MTQTVHVHMTRARLHRKLANIPKLAKSSEMLLRKISTVVFKRIYRAFQIKSRGGTDETGERWAPLSRLTVLKRLRKRRPTTDRPSSALSPEQRDKWWAYYRQALARVHEKHIAARIAWTKLKRTGGAGNFDKYGASSVLILRDSEELLNSFQPGAPRNIFRIKPGVAELGTSRKGALAHHRGARNLPRRRLWPHPSRWTPSWWQEFLSEARLGLILLILEDLK